MVVFLGKSKPLHRPPPLSPHSHCFHPPSSVLLPPKRRKSKQPADFNTFEAVYHLSPCLVSYLQPLPPPQEYPPLEYDGEWPEAVGGRAGDGFRGQEEPSGEALLLERLGESVLAEEQALEAAAGASPFDGTAAGVGAAVAAEIGVRAAERALARAALEFGAGAAGGTSSRDEDWVGLDLAFRESEWVEREDERMSDEAAAAAMAAWSDAEEAEREEGGRRLGGGKEPPRWAEGEVGEWDGGGADEAAEMSALAVTLRQYPE